MKIKIFKTNKESARYFDCENDYRKSILTIVDWDEISDKEYGRIAQAIDYTNRVDAKWYYFIVICIEQKEEHDVIYKKAADFLKVAEEEKKKDEARQLKYQKQKEEATKKRKLKQLEKLKKEFGQV